MSQKVEKVQKGGGKGSAQKIKKSKIRNFNFLIYFHFFPNSKRSKTSWGRGDQEDCGLFPLLVTFFNSEASLNSNRQSVSVTLISLSLALKPIMKTECLFLKPVMMTKCLLLKPVRETHYLFFSIVYSDNFIKIRCFRGEGGQKRNFYIEYNFQEGYLYHILKFFSM